jgi:uncharacterized membrane protein YadS
MGSGATAKRWWQEEDWLAVILGFALIAATLAGARWLTPRFAWSGMADAAALVSGENLAVSLQMGAILLLASLPGVRALGGDQRRYAVAFPAVFALAWLAQALSGHRTMVYWGIEYIIPALLLGLLVSNALGLPAWLREAVRTEFFIKTGIVIMGATMLFSDLVEAGALGMLQAVLVVAVVWAAAFRLSKRLRLDDEFAAMISTAVAICGVSAAIAACGAIQGDRRKLSYVASVVLIVAIPMIVLQPWLIRVMGLPDAVGGAWLGGTLDTTASVVAAGALVSEQAMKIGAIVKFAQNLLIGVAAFALAVWWTMRENPGRERPSARVIWERFPKFVLGFLAASLVCSIWVAPEAAADAKSTLNGLRTAWFALAFTCIGLETRFTDLLTMEQGRPLAAFVGAQAVNVVWTLILALLIFGGWFWAAPRI